MFFQEGGAIFLNKGTHFLLTFWGEQPSTRGGGTTELPEERKAKGVYSGRGKLKEGGDFLLGGKEKSSCG